MSREGSGGTVKAADAPPVQLASSKGELLERLWDAVEKQDTAAVKKLLAKFNRGSRLSVKSNPLAPAEHRGKVTSHLHLAARTGQLDIVLLLVTHGALIDGTDHAGSTPLLCAASQRHWQCVGSLLEHGANPQLADAASKTILHFLVLPGEPGDLSVQLQLLAQCLNSGCAVNAKDASGDSPLMLAASKNQLDIATVLLENGAKVNQTNADGEAPLHKAVIGDYLNMAILLLDMGADPFIISKRGTPRDLLGGAASAEPSLLHALLVTRENSYVDPFVIDLGGSGTESSSGSIPHAASRNSSAGDLAATRVQLRKMSLAAEGSSMLRTADAADQHSARSRTGSKDDGRTVSSRRRSSNLSAEPSPWGTRNNSGSLPASPSRRGKLSVDKKARGLLSGTVLEDGMDRQRLLEIKSEGQARLEELKRAQAQLEAEMEMVKHILSKLDAQQIQPNPAEADYNASLALLPDSDLLRVNRNSPSVQRVLRKPSLELEMMTPDPAYRQDLWGFGHLDDLTLSGAEFAYRNLYWGRDHSVFLSSTASVACVLHAETQNSHLVLALDESGYTKLTIPAVRVQGKDFIEACLQWLSVNLWSNADCIWAVHDAEAIKAELLDLEQNAPENSSCFRVGVVNALPGNTDEAQMFQNPMTDSFANFLQFFSERVDLQGWTGYRGQLPVHGPGTSFYTSWRKNEVMFHVAPLLDAEQQRSLLGNDTVMVYYHDSALESFPSTAPRSMMNQVFAVVRPLEEGRKLRVGFMSRKMVAEFGPAMPLNPTFDVTTSVGRALFKDFLLCRIINGYRAAVVSPPLDQLLRRPRAATLEELVKKFPASAAKRRNVLRKK